MSINDIYKLAVDNIASYPNCKLIRKTSTEAANDFPKRSLDFVYIDGNHDFGNVAMDLAKWAEKIKKGGIVAGDDYYSLKENRKIRKVSHVVNAFVKSYDINNWYVLGRKNPKSREENDGTLSFMFFKHW